MIVSAGLATAHPPDAPLNAFPARNLGLSGGIDAAAALYCVFPLESSAKHNKKAVQCTAVFVISATFCEQVPTVADTTKATLASGFLVALCARDSAGMVGFCARRAQRALFQTHSALTDAVFYTKNLGLISEISM